jgi:hypothetical protein
MSNLSEILPSNKTELEKDLVDIFRLDDYKEALDIIKNYRDDFAKMPDSAVPWLFLEYGLGGLSEFLDSGAKEALVEGQLFNSQFGTDAAIKQALGWLGVTGVQINNVPQKPFWFTVSVDSPSGDLDLVRKIVRGVLVSKAIWTRLFGVTNVPQEGYLLGDGDNKMDNVYFHDYRGANIEDINVFFVTLHEEVKAAVGTIGTILAARNMLKLEFAAGGDLYRRARYIKRVSENIAGDIEVDGIKYIEDVAGTKIYFEFLINETDLPSAQITDFTIETNVVINATVLANTPGKEYFLASEIDSATELVNFDLSVIPTGSYIENHFKLVVDLA